MRSVTVRLSPGYDILIGSGASERLSIGRRRALIVTDERVAALHLSKLPPYESHILPGGEENKSLAAVGGILEQLAESGFTRSDLIIALGGGIVGDIAGFAAACYQRGIDFIQVPTTLLAAVDSSVGGKTGVNLPAGKNLAGAFHQPCLTLCDTDFLATLPPEAMADGMAEVVKYAILDSEDFFSALENGGMELEEIIHRCVTIKAGLVERDEHDHGDRQLLNLGHSFGHAIERASDYSISHGQAVAVGLVMAHRAARELGVLKADFEPRLTALLEGLGLPTSTALPLWEHIGADKKRSGDKMTLILPAGIGKCLRYELPAAQLHGLLEAIMWK